MRRIRTGFFTVDSFPHFTSFFHFPPIFDKQFIFFETEPNEGITYEEYELFLIGFTYDQLYQRRLYTDVSIEYEEEYYEYLDDEEYIDEYEHYWY